MLHAAWALFPQQRRRPADIDVNKCTVALLFLHPHKDVMKISPQLLLSTTTYTTMINRAFFRLALLLCAMSIICMITARRLEPSFNDIEETEFAELLKNAIQIISQEDDLASTDKQQQQQQQSSSLSATRSRCGPAAHTRPTDTTTLHVGLLVIQSPC